MLKTILNEWFEDCIEAQSESVADSAGLSDAHVWKVTHEGNVLCLKRWSKQSVSAATLKWQHELLRHVGARGVRSVPQPQSNQRGQTIIDQAGYLWDLNTWMPGVALDRHNLRGQPLRLALELLAKFHIAAASFIEPTMAPAPGLLQRREIAESLAAGGLDKFASVLAEDRDVPFRDELQILVDGLGRVALGASERLSSFADRALPIQACLRDVKYDHVLFEAGVPSGLIDFGAAACDSVACDIARLVGSLKDVSSADWETAIDAYREIRSLSVSELEAIPLYDRGGIVAAAANWLRWLAVERRPFDCPETVSSQLGWLANRLQSWS